MNEMALPNPDVIEAEAKRYLTALRESWNRFNTLRLETKAAMSGTTPNSLGLQPAQVSAKVTELRDDKANLDAAKDLKDLMALIFGRLPNQDELIAGPPDGSGLDAFGVAGDGMKLAAIAGGAWQLTGKFDGLSLNEERIQKELGIAVAEPGLLDKAKKHWPAAALVGGLVLWSRRGKRVEEAEEEAEGDMLVEAEEEEIEDVVSPDADTIVEDEEEVET